jgi:hypothetical protein
LTTPSPVATGLLGGDAPLFEQGNLNAAAGEIVSGEHAHHAAADDDDVSLLRQRRTGFHMY